MDHLVWLLGWLFPCNYKYKDIKKYDFDVFARFSSNNDIVSIRI